MPCRVNHQNKTFLLKAWTCRFYRFELIWTVSQWSLFRSLRPRHRWIPLFLMTHTKHLPTSHTMHYFHFRYNFYFLIHTVRSLKLYFLLFYTEFPTNVLFSFLICKTENTLMERLHNTILGLPDKTRKLNLNFRLKMF